MSRVSDLPCKSPCLVARVLTDSLCISFTKRVYDSRYRRFDEVCKVAPRKRFTMQITVPGGEGIDRHVAHAAKKKSLCFEISVF